MCFKMTELVIDGYFIRVKWICGGEKCASVHAIKHDYRDVYSPVNGLSGLLALSGIFSCISVLLLHVLRAHLPCAVRNLPILSAVGNLRSHLDLGDYTSDYTTMTMTVVAWQPTIGLSLRKLARVSLHCTSLMSLMNIYSY